MTLAPAGGKGPLAGCDAKQKRDGDAEIDDETETS
jgi:hypothetical protein